MFKWHYCVTDMTQTNGLEKHVSRATIVYQRFSQPKTADKQSNKQGNSFRKISTWYKLPLLTSDLSTKMQSTSDLSTKMQSTSDLSTKMQSIPLIFAMKTRNRPPAIEGI